jgi:hypothetical protein
MTLWAALEKLVHLEAAQQSGSAGLLSRGAKLVARLVDPR